MVSKTLDAWLNDFVTRKIADLVRWRRSPPSEPSIKQETVEEAEYSHDYSNLRSHHVAAPTEERKLQLLEVLSSGTVATAFASDGESRIQVRLYEDAVAALEAEMDTKLVAGMKGDVFTLEKFALVCTHMGPSDGFVQLEIEQLSYDYSLRKIVGQPAPVEDRADVAALLGEVGMIWNKENPVAIESDSNDDDDPASQVSPMQHRPLQISPVRNARPSSSARADSLDKPRTATQLEVDGFEIHQGVNLDPPLQASMRPPASRNSAQQLKPTKPEQLQQLMGQIFKQGAITLQESSQSGPDPAPASQISFNVPDVHTSASPHLRSEKLPTSRQPLRDLSSPTTRRAPSTPEPRPQGATSKITVETSPVAPLVTTVSPALSAFAPPANQYNSASQHPPASASVTSQARISHSRCEVPKDQKALLDHPSSWFPPLPGRQFPIPNVPVGLLKSWSDIATLPGMASVSEQPKTIISPSRSILSSVPGSSSSSSAEEFSASQWPPTPLRREPGLPPDSSFRNAVHENPDDDDLEMSVPQALTIPGSSSRKRKFVQTPPSVPHGRTHSLSSTSQSSHPEFPSLERSSASLKSSRSISPSKNFQSSTTHSAFPSHQVLPSQMQQHRQPTSSPNLVTHPSSSTRHSVYEISRSDIETRSREPAQGFPQPSSPRCAAKLLSITPPPGIGITKITPRDQGRDEGVSDGLSKCAQGRARQSQTRAASRSDTMESSENETAVPIAPSSSRSMSRDRSQPTKQDLSAIKWHAHRRAYFKGQQRRDWLRRNYIPDQNGKTRLLTVVVRYRRAFPRDEDATENDFLSVVPDAFPDVRGISPRMTFSERADAEQTPPIVPPSTSWEDREPMTELPSLPGSSNLPTSPRRPSPVPDIDQRTGTEVPVDYATPPARQPVVPSSTIPKERGWLGQSRTRGIHPANPESALTRSQSRRPNRQPADITPIFEVFHDQWTSIAPGGYYAEPQQRREGTSSKTTRRRVDVLTWDI